MSGCNFAITILYARFFGPASFGTYALITVAQQYFVSVSVSLVGNPLITTAPHVQDDIERARLIQGSFAAQLIVGAALAFLAAAGMSICLLMGVAGVSAQTVAALVASTLGLATLEWMRRLCFLNRDGSSLLRFDAITYLPIVVAAIVLAGHDLLTLDTAVLLWGISSIAACLYAVRRLRLPSRPAGARGFLSQHWRASRDFVASFQAQWLGSQGIVYLAAPVVGASGIGAYRSVAGLLGFTNALGTTLDNMLPLRFADAYRKGSDLALRKQTLRFGVALTGLLLLLLLPAGIFCRQIVGFLLGDAYVPYATILWVHGIGVSIVFASRFAIYHERARMKTHRIAIAAAVGAAVSTLLVIIASKALGPAGIAWSVALGGAVSLLYLCAGIVRAARKG